VSSLQRATVEDVSRGGVQESSGVQEPQAMDAVDRPPGASGS